LLKHFQLLDNYFGLILPYAALEMPFALVIMKSFFDDFPTDIEEAAWVDGAGRLASFSRVVLPNFVAPMIVVIVFTFLFSWNEFLLALIVMTDNAMKTVALAPLAFQGVYQSDEGTLIASLVLVSIPVVVLYFAVQRFIDIGVSSGAVKG
jgi:raffinose/stachyose/melibiose transport system permease protein